MVKSFQVVFYTISHYKPIDFSNNKLLELITIANDLPRINMMMFAILKLFGQKEKRRKFEKHTLGDLKKELVEEQKKDERKQDQEFIDQANSIISYLSHLKIQQIITPVKKITEFLEDDFIATDPKFPGNCIDAALVAEEENKRMNNMPIRSKTAWMKWVLLLLLIVIIAFAVYMAYDAGAFDVITTPFEGLGDIGIPQLTSPQQGDLLKKYPTPESMRAAIDRGELQYSSLPPNIKAMVDNVPSVGTSP